MARVVVGELDDQNPLVFGQRRRDLFDQLLLPLDVDRRKQLVVVNRLQQRLVLVLALLFGIREGWDMAQLAIELQLRGAALGELQQFLGSRHLPMLRGRRSLRDCQADNRIRNSIVRIETPARERRRPTIARKGLYNWDLHTEIDSPGDPAQALLQIKDDEGAGDVF